VKGARAADGDMKETRTAILSMSREGFSRTRDESNESGICFKQENFHVELLQFAKSANVNFNLSQKKCFHEKLFIYLNIEQNW
jgi:hypothetical protein